MPIINNELISVQGDLEDVEPIPTTSLGEYIEGIIKENVAKHGGDAVWMTDLSTGRCMTYNKLAQSVHSIASGLYRRGLRRNDAVMIMGSNFVEIPPFFIGTWRAGGHFVATSSKHAIHTIRDKIVLTKPKFILTEEADCQKILEAISGLDYVKEVFVVGQAEGCTPVDVLLEDNGDACPERLVDSELEDKAWILYSSGTTGDAKAIVHTQRAGILMARNYKTNAIAKSKVLFVNGMTNTSGFGLAICSIVGQGTCYTFSEDPELDQILESIEKFKPTTVSLFPPHIAKLCRHEELNKYDVSSVIGIAVGGSSMNPIYERQIYDEFPSLLFIMIIYGLTETNVISINAPAPSELRGLTKQAAIERHRIGCVGRLQPYCKIKIIDRETGEKLGPGEVGELCARTPFMTKGFLNNPEETKKLFHNGWYHTGDKAYYTNDEQLFIIGRYKECIKYGGWSLTPSSIESQIITHPDVKDVAVVGKPDDVEGELPLAFVVLKEGRTTSVQELVDYTEGNSFHF